MLLTETFYGGTNKKKMAKTPKSLGRFYEDITVQNLSFFNKFSAHSLDTPIFNLRSN